MRDNHGNLVDLGNYDMIGGLYDSFGEYDYTKVTVPIEIVPEPSTLLLLGFGILSIHRRKIRGEC
jgi:hypothetical protein